jgi:hypothetical protein
MLARWGVQLVILAVFPVLRKRRGLVVLRKEKVGRSVACKIPLPLLFLSGQLRYDDSGDFIAFRL